MTDAAWPKPGERWTTRSDKSLADVLIHDIVKKQICYYVICKPDKYSGQEQKQSDPDYTGIDWFLENFRKSTPVFSGGITHEINVVPTTMHLAFEPESTRLSCLSVKVENPDFLTCEMEINGSAISDPLEYLAYLVPAEVQKMMFGAQADIPDFPATAAHIIDMAATTRSGLHDFSVQEVEILRTKAYAALDKFNGLHEHACKKLFEDLRDWGFRKPEDMMHTRKNPTMTEFMEEVWVPIQSYLKEEIEAGRLPGPDCNGEHPSEPC